MGAILVEIVSRRLRLARYRFSIVLEGGKCFIVSVIDLRNTQAITVVCMRNAMTLHKLNIPTESVVTLLTQKL